MNEVYWTRYAQDEWREPGNGGFELGKPQDFQLQEGEMLCGNALAAYPALQVYAQRHVAALPRAAAMLELAPGLLRSGVATSAENALPLYVRNKVAQTKAEREQIKRDG
jgi:tRNA threonylcarbamoyladenosine biosynthesis protein TsaB